MTCANPASHHNLMSAVPPLAEEQQVGCIKAWHSLRYLRRGGSCSETGLPLPDLKIATILRYDVPELT